MPLLLLLFIGIPLIEIAIFVQMGSVLSLGWILLIVVATAIVGTFLVRQQGAAALNELRRSFDELRDPSKPLADGAMILFSGALLITPGFFTDTIGFLLLVPGVRAALYRAIKSRVTIIQPGQPGPRHPSDPTIIDGDYTEVPRDESTKKGPSGWTQP